MDDYITVKARSKTGKTQIDYTSCEQDGYEAIYDIIIKLEKKNYEIVYFEFNKAINNDGGQ